MITEYSMRNEYIHFSFEIVSYTSDFDLNQIMKRKGFFFKSYATIVNMKDYAKSSSQTIQSK